MSDFQEEVTTESTSLRDDIMAAMSATETAAEENPATTIVGAPVEAEQPKADRARDEAGKFVKKPDEPDKAPEIPQEVKADKPEPEPASKAAEIEPPKSWNAEARQKWGQVPPELREYIVQRDKEQADGVAKLKTQYEGKAKFAEEIWEEVAPHVELMRREGATPKTAISALLQDAAVLRLGTPEQKARLFMERAAQFGVDIAGLANLPPQQRPDPHLSAIQQELAQLKGYVSQRERLEAEQRQGALFSEIQSFSADKPYFEDVKPVMAALLESGHAQDLASAYDMAVFANPTIRAKVLAEQQAQAVQGQAAKAQQVTAQAKAKAVSVTGAPGGSAASAAPPEDLRALIASQVYGEGRV